MEHRDILRREFDRIAQLTDEAYATMMAVRVGGGPAKTLEKQYTDWAALLLRYHQAIEGIETEADQRPLLPSMKAGGWGSLYSI